MKLKIEKFEEMPESFNVKFHRELKICDYLSIL